MFGTGAGGGAFIPADGRWPGNAMLDEDAAQMLDEQSGMSSDVAGPSSHRASIGYGGSDVEFVTNNYGDSGGASRFYYVAKPSREERDYGCERLPMSVKRILGSGITSADHPETASGGGDRHARNIHPTVKPIELMRWLVKLITPIGGTVLDPFTGSGTTGMACRYELREFIGIEREAEYVEIATARIAAVAPLFSESA